MSEGLTKEFCRIKELLEKIMKSIVRMKKSLNEKLSNKDCCYCKHFLSDKCSGRYSPSIICSNFGR